MSETAFEKTRALCSRQAIRKRALVIDDDAENLAFTAEALHSFAPGFDVATSTTTERAIDWLKTFPPDIVIVDRGSNDEGIRKLMECLRQQPATLHCKVIVAVKDDAVASLANLAQPVGATLTKPMALRLLLDTVRDVLRTPAEDE